MFPNVLLGPVHTNAFSFENAYFFYPFSPSAHTNTIENGGVCLRKRRFSKALSRVEVFENGGSASLCGRVKTEVQRLCVDGRKRRFSKTITSLHWHVPVKKSKTDVFLSVFGGVV